MILTNDKLDVRDEDWAGHGCRLGVGTQRQQLSCKAHLSVH